MGKNLSDTRNEQRRPVKVFINYRTIDQFFSEMGTNLSVGGVFVRSTNPLPVGTEIKISFNIPQFGCYLESMGVVVHNGTVENPGMGIKFKNLSERAKRLLSDVLEHELLSDGLESETRKASGEKRGKRRITVRVESRGFTKGEKVVAKKKKGVFKRKSRSKSKKLVKK